jgi:hypothetical protein
MVRDGPTRLTMRRQTPKFRDRHAKARAEVAAISSAERSQERTYIEFGVLARRQPEITHELLPKTTSGFCNTFSQEQIGSAFSLQKALPAKEICNQSIGRCRISDK